MHAKQHKFDVGGLLALRYEAFGEYFPVFSALPQPFEKHGDTLVVNVRGPLMHHESWCCDSYDGVKCRVALALEQKPKAIVLSIDSPGGLVSGCFDTACEIAALCEGANVPLYSYVDGQACSAAYALACVADKVVIPSAGEAGSIGCIAEMVSTAKLDAAMGIDRAVIASGARKTDGNPGVPLTDDRKASIQAKVNRMAGIFADHVADHRGMSPEDVLRLEAGVFVGRDAITQGLCDAEMGLDEMLAAIASGEFAEAPAAATEKKTMTIKASAEEDKKPFSKAQAAYKASLQAIMDDEKASDEDKEEAKAALAKMEDKEEKPQAADSSAPPPPPKKESEESKATAGALAEVRAFLDGQKAATAKAEADRVKADAEEKTKLIASRPDLEPTTKALLANATLADVRDYVAKHPKRKAAPAATAGTLATTRTKTQGTAAADGTVVVGSELPEMVQDPRAARLMRLAMGTEKAEARVVQRGPQLVIGAQAEAVLDGETA